MGWEDSLRFFVLEFYDVMKILSCNKVFDIFQMQLAKQDQKNFKNLQLSPV